ncbi:MAG: beta-ketoacyl-ACP synthase II [Rhodothermales bacterium]
MSNRTRVVVTGLGAVTPLGLTVDTFWDGMKKGASGAGPITHFERTKIKTHFACELKGFNAADYLDRKMAKRYDPYCTYALVATQQAVADAGFDAETMPQEQKDEVAVVYGTGIGGITMLEQQSEVLFERGANRLSPFLVPMMISNMAAGAIAITYGFRGPNHAIVTACATGNHAIGDALLLLRAGQAEVVVCGGSEAPISAIALGGFNAMKALSTRNDDPEHASRPFDIDRDGFVAGEGAGTLVLETLEHAQARGATIYAELLGFGASSDAYHFAAPDPTGSGVELAMKRALKDAQIDKTDVDYINMHATSTPLGDIAETQAIKNVYGDHAYNVHLSGTKSMTGHLLGAAGAVEGIASILAIRDGIIPPTINLVNHDPQCDLNYTPNEAVEADVRIAVSNAFGFGGHNTTAVFARFDG